MFRAGFLLSSTVTRAVNLQFRKFSRSSSMSNPKRYFINKFQDYDGKSTFSDQDWNSKINSTVNIVAERQPPSIRDADGGLYVGISGIGYMFYHVSQSSTLSVEKAKYLKRGLEYIEPSLEYAERHRDDKSQKSAFLLGNAGVYAVAAALYNAVGKSHVSLGKVVD